jgi:hypothetical protein
MSAFRVLQPDNGARTESLAPSQPLESCAPAMSQLLRVCLVSAEPDLLIDDTAI